MPAARYAIGFRGRRTSRRAELFLLLADDDEIRRAGRVATRVWPRTLLTPAGLPGPAPGGYTRKIAILARMMTITTIEILMNRVNPIQVRRCRSRSGPITAISASPIEEPAAR